MKVEPNLGVMISTLLGVLVGLAVIWIVLSLITGFIQEWIVRRLKWRPMMLEMSISNMLGDPILANQFYDHPFIKSHFTGEKADDKPSLIPAPQFALTIIDIILSSASNLSLLQKKLYRIQNETVRLGKNDQVNANARLDRVQKLVNACMAREMTDVDVERTFPEIMAELDVLTKLFPLLQPVVETSFQEVAVEKEQITELINIYKSEKYADKQVLNTMEQIRIGLIALGVVHPDLKRTLSTLLVGADEYLQGENGLLTVRKNIEEWFNNGLNHLSTWYGARAQVVALLISISLAVFINADALQIVSLLWAEPALQQSSQLGDKNFPIGWLGTAYPTDSTGAVALADGTQRSCTLSPRSSVDLFGLNVVNQCYSIVNTPRFTDLTGWMLKFVGLLITGFVSAALAPLSIRYLTTKLKS